MTLLQIEVPQIPFPGGQTQAHYYRAAARNLEGGFPVGGSNLKAAVVQLLKATAASIEASARPEFVTYKRADGKLIQGEYSFVTDIDYFDGDAEEQNCLDVIEERWQLVSSRTLKFGTTSRWCSECDEDVELDEPVTGPVYCAEHQPTEEK